MAEDTSHPEHARPRSQAAFVGRARELGLLLDTARRAADGEGTIVAVCGPAGSGKTRLVEEVRASVPPTLRWMQGRARARTTNIPFFPFAQLVANAWGIAAADPAEEVERKVGVGTEPLADLLPDTAAYLSRLLAPDSRPDAFSPQVWRSEIPRVIHRLLCSLSEQQPTVMCLEDLHWADPSSISLLEYLTSAPDSGVLLLCLHRPTVALLGATSDSGSARFERIDLAGLSRADAETLACSLLGTDRLPPGLADRIAADATPFRIEQLLQELVESGSLVLDGARWRLLPPAEEARTPTTLDDIISSRVDRLAADARHVLSEAAVIGLVVPHELLTRVTEEGQDLGEILAELLRHELIRPSTSGGTGGAPEESYVFGHDLTHEAAYALADEHERSRIHERVAAVIEETGGRQLTRATETLAFHYARGLSLGKAIQFLVRAASTSIDTFALEEAHRDFQQAYDLACALADRGTEGRSILLDAVIAWIMLFAHRGEFEAMYELLQEHRSLAIELGDPVRMAALDGGMLGATWGTGRMRECYELGERTRALAQQAQSPQLLAMSLHGLTWAAMETGRLRDAAESGWMAHRMVREQAAAGPITDWASLQFQSTSLHGVAMAYWYLGEVGRAFELSDYLELWSVEMGDRRGTSMAGVCRGHALHSRGDLAEAAQHMADTLELPMDPNYAFGFRLWRAIALAEDGSFEEAEAEFESVRRASRGRHRSFQSLAELWLGYCLCARGEHQAGLALIDEAARFFDDNGADSRRVLAEYVLSKAWLRAVEREAADRDGVVEPSGQAAALAEEHLKRAVRDADAIEARGIACPARIALAELFATTGRHAMARQTADEAIADAEERGATGWAERARAVIG